MQDAPHFQMLLSLHQLMDSALFGKPLHLEEMTSGFLLRDNFIAASFAASLRYHV
jgi:hypothetical protein